MENIINNHKAYTSSNLMVYSYHAPWLRYYHFSHELTAYRTVNYTCIQIIETSKIDDTYDDDNFLSSPLAGLG